MITIYAITALFAIAAQAFFTAGEMAFTSVNRIKLKGLVASGDQKAVKLDAFLSGKGAFLGITLAGTNLSVIISSALAARVFAEYFPARYSPMIVTAVMVPITLVVAEIIPKIIARQFANQLALNLMAPLKGFNRLFSPLITAVNWIAGVLLRPFRKHARPWDMDLTIRDLKSLLHFGHETGGVEKDEFELIHKVLDLGAKTVSGSMIPLCRVHSAGKHETVGDLKKIVALVGFSRIPVYDNVKNNIVGIVNIYDVLFDMETNVDTRGIDDFIRDPIHVKEDDGLDIALARLRHQRQPMGIVTKIDGGIVGIITIEDILEELVGNIEDT
ncbi:MAG: hemolysin family protein [Candidatus Omnitrophica bacterium]|nr:hemolysin family protein [Candidatus Omnitrophota bacterium]MBU1128735.1 hemolysin family protein [Candidatus Omnitrophota bacterium]MBU1784009.1 hemolysin family protein [Candidatus Omnitrophota bacterium]MBU1851786.1 hemolysin family protein [Candidatus Omnitrophota bacterium]